MCSEVVESDRSSSWRWFSGGRYYKERWATPTSLTCYVCHVEADQASLRSAYVCLALQDRVTSFDMSLGSCLVGSGFPSHSR
jgi:hypothetical protein